MSVLALDLSSTATGICEDVSNLGILGEPGTGWTATHAPKGDLLTRARSMRNTAESYARNHDLVVIEAIGTAYVGTAIAIATVHALVLDAIADDHRILVVSPKELKKWATGKGNADKTAMLLAAKRSGWVDPPGATDDQADAWWLWTIGHATRGLWKVPETAYRAEVLDAITNPKPKTRKPS